MRLPRDIVEGVSERTGGVPLFVEEVTRLLLERGEQGGAQAIPPTLQQSLAARLDRLGAARETAQIGAVLGRGFSYALLQSVAGLDGAGLQSALERLAEADILFIEGDGPQANYRFKHALIQDAAYESLLKSRRQALHRRAAEILRNQPERAAAEPEVLAHHFTQAGLDDLGIEWWGRAGDQALRRSAFQEAIAHLGRAIEMADKLGAVSPRATGGSAAERLTQLHVSYGNALTAARGYGAPETTEAFAKARESAAGDKDALGRLAADWGLWTGSFLRGDLPSMRAHAEAFLSDIEARPDSPEAGVAHRAAGMTCWFAGEYREARDHFERALAVFQPGRDDDLAFRFGHDPGVAAMANLATACWPLGEVDRAMSLIDRAQERIADLTHVGTHAYGKMRAAMFELMRGDHARATPNAFELVRLSREYDLNLWRAFGVFLQGWAASRNGAPAGGLEDMRRGVELLREQNVLWFDGLLKIALAEAEARAGDPDRAVAILDEALAAAGLGNRAFEAELHRARGEILLKRDPANPAPAEEAFLTAIAVAKQQGTRSFQLRAALSLAKLYQSTDRPAEAHAVLEPALEGFSPTSQMPEIAEGQALLALLAESHDVKIAIERRRHRLDLQTSYGQALLWAKGFTAEESKAAFARVDEIVGPAKDLATRIALCDAQCLRSFMRGEYREAREIAEVLLREAGEDARGAESGTVRRMLGLVHLYEGNLKEAQSILEREATEFQLGPADHVTAAAFLALTEWHLGEIERARQSIERAIQRADETADAASIGTALFFRTILESRRDDVSATRLAADALLGLSEQYGMKTYSDQGKVYANWARGRLLDPDFGANELEQALTAYTAEGNRADAPSLYGLLAELEVSEPGPERSLRSIDRGLAIADETGEHFTDSYLHRLRGELLLKRNPSEPTPAEEAFKAAIAVAKVQGARSYELLASLSLAKLYQSTGRPADAHAVLAPALEGFSLTAEMPEIAEAQKLLVAIGAGVYLRHE
jgi:predicted ATPase